MIFSWYIAQVQNKHNENQEGKMKKIFMVLVSAAIIDMFEEDRAK